MAAVASLLTERSMEDWVEIHCVYVRLSKTEWRYNKLRFISNIIWKNKRRSYIDFERKDSNIANESYSTSDLPLLPSGVDVIYEVPERSEKIINTGTPFRLVYGWSSIYDDHKKIRLFKPPPDTCVHMRLTSSAPCSRDDIKYTPLSENI